GFEEQENGTYLLVHKKGTSEVLVDTGGAMFMKIRFLTEKDSVFVDVNAASQTPSYPMRIDKPAFKGDFLDMLAKLHPGDSATFYVRLDSLKKHYPSEFKFEPKFDTMKYLGFNVVVDSIYSRSKVEDFRKKAEAEQDKQMEEMRKVQAVMTPIQQKAKEMEPELKKKDAQLLKPYLAQNKITVKPDADGIYYQETDPGDGTPLMPGMYVGMKYTGKYLDGTIFDANTLVDGQEPYYFHLGQDPMIPGFTNCIMKMKNHGKAIFILPPKMGYNDGLTRVFEVEITDAKKQ
ncbi:MAG TPA: FKBP-type peptidyl-prolyl cis-trans isomerase, partial [Bacteroidia bacterium]|nr:FKBP-type peptidyl-prolyl cis-trans isomerase [Bacteroidia bacterium]